MRKASRPGLNLPLAEKNHDLKQYLTGVDDPEDEVVEYWLQSGVFRSYVSGKRERNGDGALLPDLETLLQFLQHDAIRCRLRSGGEPRHRGSLPLA